MDKPNYRRSLMHFCGPLPTSVISAVDLLSALERKQPDRQRVFSILAYIHNYPVMSYTSSNQNEME